jgi:hypothetical protein
MSEDNAIWAVVELMGHAQSAGRLTKPTEWGGLWQLDVPDGDAYRTEFISTAAIYRVRMVSEEIARAYAKRERAVIAYDDPIVTREAYHAAVSQLEAEGHRLRMKNATLEQRLIAVNALPAPGLDHYPDEDGSDDPRDD